MMEEYKKMVFMSRKKKILILSRWYFPAKNPRAFRTKELVKELFRRGKYDITAVLPSFADLQDCAVDAHFIPTISVPAKCGKDGSVSLKDRILEQIRSVLRFIVGDSPGNIIYSFRLYFVLRKLFQEEHYDVVMSISFPFYIHVAVALAMKYSNFKSIFIADCGDPFYVNPSYKMAFYLKWLEKYFLSKFDYVTIPMNAARKSYADYGIDGRIRIIPQGFAITQIADDAYKKNPVPAFCFAGLLYEKIRNPRYFLDYLLQVKQDFVFVVYALPDAFTIKLLQEYKEKLGERLEIREPLPREELIHVMATMEFVVNFDNENSNQKPSKLIDYAMSRRPILSFNSRTFKPKVFKEFLQGNYAGQEQIDLSQYDICNVVDKFEELFAEIR